MKHTILLAALIATLGFAQGPPEGGRRGPRPDPAFTALDTDADLTLSQAEIAAAPAALAKLDRNSDGKLSEDELRPAGPPAQRQEDLTDTLMAFDKNADGKLTRAELPERMRNIFARADSNHDDVLTRDELKASTAAQKSPGESVMGGRPGEGGREGGRQGGREGGPGGPGGMMRFSPILSALDSDHDGVINAAEIAAAPAALKSLDKDADGKLTQDEVRPAFGRRPEGRDRI